MGNYQPIVPRQKHSIVQIVLSLVSESTFCGVKLCKFVLELLEFLSLTANGVIRNYMSGKFVPEAGGEITFSLTVLS